MTVIWLLCAANVLYLASYAVRDIVLLRALAIVAAACLIPYFWLRPDPLMGPVYWNLVFIGLNAFGIMRRARARVSGTTLTGLKTLPRSAVIRLQADDRSQPSPRGP
jgi:hypothetical protein